jgi:hypothetical protein
MAVAQVGVLAATNTYCSVVLCYCVMCEGRYFYAYTVASAVEIATDRIVAGVIADYVLRTAADP